MTNASLIVAEPLGCLWILSGCRTSPKSEATIIAFIHGRRTGVCPVIPQLADRNCAGPMQKAPVNREGERTAAAASTPLAGRARPAA